MTGSDTGVGKTVLTALLTAHLRGSGFHALALKPFCSGARHDALLLEALQEGDLTLDEINPWYFPEPLAPFVAARIHRRVIRPADVLRHISSVGQTLVHKSATLRAPRPPTLLLEGVGGLLVPLADHFSVLDLIERLRCEVLVVASNTLGTINHTLLTIQFLRRARVRTVGVVLMDARSADASCASNPGILSELVAPIPVLQLPFLRPRPGTVTQIRRQADRLRRTLSKLLR